MTVTRESLVKRFGRLNDDELLKEFQSGELTALAQDVAMAELQQRRIDLSKSEPETPPPSAPPADVGDASSTEDLVQVARFNDPVSAYLLQSRLKVCRRSSRTLLPIKICHLAGESGACAFWSLNRIASAPPN